MIGRSHIVLGVACVATAATAGYLPFSIASLVAGACGSLAPDLDTERSTLGCRLVWLSRPLSRLVGHRTITHTLAIPCLIAWLVLHYGGSGALNSAWGSFALGYISHILADLVTGGCWALYPLSRHRISLWPYAKVGSLREYALLLACLGALGAVAYQNLDHARRDCSASRRGTHCASHIAGQPIAFIAMNGTGAPVRVFSARLNAEKSSLFLVSKVSSPDQTIPFDRDLF